MSYCTHRAGEIITSKIFSISDLTITVCKYTHIRVVYCFQSRHSEPTTVGDSRCVCFHHFCDLDTWTCDLQNLNSLWHN